MAYLVRNGARGYPDTGVASATIHVYETGTTTHATGLVDLDGNAIDNTAGFAVPSDDFWGFSPADYEKYDVYWEEEDKYLVKNAVLRDLSLDVSFESPMTGPITIPEVSAKASFTPAIPNFNGTLTGEKWRIGSQMHIHVRGVASGAVSGSLILTLPDSLGVDTTVFSPTSYAVPVGQLSIRDVSSAIKYQGVVALNGPDSVVLYCYYDSGDKEQVTAFDASTPVALESGDLLDVVCIVPISGWDNQKTVNVGVASADDVIAHMVASYPEFIVNLGGESAPSQATIDALVAAGVKEENILWTQTVFSSPSSSVSSSPSASASGSGTPSSSPSASISNSPSASESASESSSPSESASGTPSSSLSASESSSPSSSESSSPSSSESASESSSPSVSESSSPSSSPSASESASPSSSPSGTLATGSYSETPTTAVQRYIAVETASWDVAWQNSSTSSGFTGGGTSIITSWAGLDYLCARHMVAFDLSSAVTGDIPQGATVDTGTAVFNFNVSSLNSRNSATAVLLRATGTSNMNQYTAGSCGTVAIPTTGSRSITLNSTGIAHINNELAKAPASRGTIYFCLAEYNFDGAVDGSGTDPYPSNDIRISATMGALTFDWTE